MSSITIQLNSMYLEQFDNKNLSINPELAKIFIVEVIMIVENMLAQAPVYIAKVLVGRGHKLFTDTDGEGGH